jgi:hypothetical protein
VHFLLSSFSLPLLTGKVGDAFAAGRQFCFLDYQHRKAVLDFEMHVAAVASQLFPLQRQMSPAWIHGAPEDIEQILANHESCSSASMAALTIQLTEDAIIRLPLRRRK